MMNTAKCYYSYTAGPWMSLGYGSPGNWSLQTKVDLRTRSDTGSPNNNPVTTAFPVYRYIVGVCIFTL